LHDRREREAVETSYSPNGRAPRRLGAGSVAPPAAAGEPVGEVPTSRRWPHSLCPVPTLGDWQATCNSAYARLAATCFNALDLGVTILELTCTCPGPWGTFFREFPSCCQSARSDTRRRESCRYRSQPLSPTTSTSFLSSLTITSALAASNLRHLCVQLFYYEPYIVRGGDLSVYDNVIDSLSFANTRHFILAICCECTAESPAAGLMSFVFLFESAFGQDWVKLEA